MTPNNTTGSYLFPGPSDHYGPFHQTFPITFNGSLVRRMKIWSDGPAKMPQTSVTQMSYVSLSLNDKIIAVCTYHLVMISTDLSETAQKSALEIRDKIQSETKSKNFFFQQIFFLMKEKFLDFVSD